MLAGFVSKGMEQFTTKRQGTSGRNTNEENAMNQMSKFRRSWLLFKSSLSIIGRNKQLLVFPVLIFTLTCVIVLFFLAPVLLRPTGYSFTQAEHWEAIGNSLFTHADAPAEGQGAEIGFTPVAIAYLVFLYFVAMFLATFFNVAFYNEILAALSGQPVSIGRGLKFAGTRLKAVLMWTLFAGLVGLIIKAIEQRLELVGRLIARFLGLAWSIAAVFVIPIIVREEQNANPVNLLRRSAGILKRTWGEALIGYVGLSFANALIAIGSFLLLIGAVVASIALNNFWILALVGVCWLLAMFAWSYLTSVASQVYKGALYLYAAEGVIPEPYNREMLDQAWKFKKS